MIYLGEGPDHDGDGARLRTVGDWRRNVVRLVVRHRIYVSTYPQTVWGAGLGQAHVKFILSEQNAFFLHAMSFSPSVSEMVHVAKVDLTRARDRA
jgi:hypothetical protein